MTITTRKETVKQNRARAAVSEFRKLQPTLTAYARNLTGKRDVRVEMSAKDNGSTDGTKIFFKPPIKLGDMASMRHERSLCDKRDPETLELFCKACGLREAILATIYHEIAHIAFDSFAAVTLTDAKTTLKMIQRFAPKWYYERIADKFLKDFSALSGKRTFTTLAHAVNPYFKLMVNALEDVRINERMADARPGTRIMQDAQMLRIANEGVEQHDERGQIINLKWSEYDLNHQVCVAALCVASGYGDLIDDWFTDRVVAAVRDANMQVMLKKVHALTSAQQVFEHSFEVFMRLRELGFFILKDEEPPPAPEAGESDDSTDGSDDAGEGDSGSEAPDSPGDSSGESGSSEPDADGGSAPDHGGSESSRGSDGDSDSPDNEGDSGDSGSSVDDGSPSRSDAHGARSEGGSEDDSDLDRRLGSEQPSEGRDASGDDRESDRLDDGDESEAADGTDDSMGEDSGSRSDDGDDDAEPGIPDAAEDDRDDVPEVSDERGDSDVPASSGPEDGDGDSGEDSFTDDDGEVRSSERDRKDGDAYQPDDHKSAEGLHPEDDDSDALGASDSDAVDDEDPIDYRPEAESAVDMTDSEYDPVKPTIASDEPIELIDLGLHPQTDDPAESVDPSMDKAIDNAIVQSIYFEMPSQNITGLKVWKYDDRFEDSKNRSWHAWNSRRGSGSRGMRVDPVGEPVLGPALMRMRVVFSDNLRSRRNRNQRAGKIDTRTLGKRAWSGDDRLFGRKTIPAKKDYFVAIMLDVSGSTIGMNIKMIKEAALAQAELCHRMGIAFAVYAHTGSPENDTDWMGGTWVDLYEVKAPEQAWDDKARAALMDLSPSAANLDGHTLEFARKLADAQPQTNKVILYYSDGAMPLENHDEELEILRREISTCKAKGYTLLGVGVRTDSPSRHGLDTVQIDNSDEVGRVVSHLERVLVG